MREGEVRGQVIAFPRQLRVVPLELDEDRSSPAAEDDLPAVVEHDGRQYDLPTLMRCLAPRHFREIGGMAPRSGQDAWDAVVRRWPALAAEIVASVSAVSSVHG